MSKLKCIKDLIMNPCAIAGKDYEIVGDYEYSLEIINEFDEIHGFSKDPKSDHYYGKWFEEVEQG